MLAITVDNQSPGNPLQWTEVPTPTISAHEVLLEVKASAINRADLLQREGKYPPPPGASEILGLEAAGTISQLGEEVSGWEIGQEVCTLLSGGGYATHVAVPQEMLMPIPSNWNFQQAASMPEVFYTAYVNLFLEGKLQAGERVLIHGGASGVGTAAIQLAVAAGAEVVVTAGSDEKLTRCKELGATTTINYRNEDFAAVLTQQNTGVDVILDMVGANYFERNLSLLNKKGRLVVIALMGGAKAELNLRPLLTRRLSVHGSVLRGRSQEEKTAIRNSFMEDVWPKFETDELKPVIDCSYSIEETETAHEYMRQNKNIGKIILKTPALDAATQDRAL